MQTIANIALLIISIALIAWAVTLFVQPQLPPSINSAIYYAFAALTTTAGFFGAFKEATELMRVLDEHRSRHILTEKFGRGPYDRATIERATHYYIVPKCSNVDPTQEAELRHVPFLIQESLMTKVDYFFDHDYLHRHLLILGDSGTGKTSFVLNYYAHNARRFGGKRHNMALVPLGEKNADELISNIPNPEDTLLFLDAFDEDTKAISDHRSRIGTLMEHCNRFAKVIITCRTQFFPRDEEIPVETGILKLSPRKAGEKHTYEFWKLYILPFDDKEIKKYLNMRYSIWSFRSRRMANALVSKIPLLSVRPMLLAHIPDLVDRGGTISQSHELYEAMIDAWLERESFFVNKTLLRRFSEELAIDMYLNAEARGTERVPPAQLSNVSTRSGTNLANWQLTGRSLLNRDAEGNYKFAHRSIMEYLFVNRLIHGDSRCYGIRLTDQMKQFLIEMLSIKPTNGFLAQWIIGRDVFVYCENVGADRDKFLSAWQNGAFARQVLQEGPFEERDHTIDPLIVDFSFDQLARPAFTIANPAKWEVLDSEFSLFDPNTALFVASALFKASRKQYKCQHLISLKGLHGSRARITPISFYFESPEISEFRVKFGYDVLTNLFNINLSGAFMVIPVHPSFERCDIVIDVGSPMYVLQIQQTLNA